MRFYKGFENCLPASIKQNPDFIPISQVESKLLCECCGNAPRQERDNNYGFQNPFARNQEDRNENNFVGGGVQINSEHQPNNAYADYWRNKGDEDA